MKPSQHHLSLHGTVIDSVDLTRVMGGQQRDTPPTTPTTPPTPPTTSTTTTNTNTTNTTNTNMAGAYCTKGLDYNIRGKGTGKVRTPVGVEIEGGFDVDFSKCQ